MKGRRRLLVVGCIALMIGLSAFVALRFELSTEITHFLPAESKELRHLVQHLAASAASRRMTISIAGKTPLEARVAAKELEAALAENPEVAWVESGPDATLGQSFYRLYFPRRYNFLASDPERELPARLAPAALRRAAKELKASLRLPTATLLKRIAGADPLGFFSAWIRRLAEARPAGLRVVEGHYQSREGDALLFLATRHGAFSFQHQAPLLASMDAAFAAITRKHGASLRMRRSGINRHAVSARRSIESDVERISIISTVAVIALLGLVFRSSRLLLLAALPLATGILSALALNLALFGSIHGLTLAFGATLIGICIDYPVHYFNHYLVDTGQDAPATSLAAVWPGLRTGAATTILGFLLLLFSDYPAIRQVALFAATGILVALLTTRYVLPLFLPARSRPSDLQRRSAAALGRALERMAAHRFTPALFPLLALLVMAAGLPFARWDDDLNGLNSPDAALLAEDAQLRRRVAEYETGRLVIARGDSMERALQVNDAVAARLEGARRQGLLLSFRSLHTFLWSKDLQQRNFRTLQRDKTLLAGVRRAFEAEGFVPGAFAPFAASLEAPFSPLTWPELARSPLGHPCRAFVVSSSEGVTLLTLLSGIKDAPALARSLAGVRGATYLDQRQLMNKAYAAHRDNAVALASLGVLAVWLLVFVRYRSWRLALLAGLPALLACLTTVAVLGLLAVELNFLHLLSLLVVFSMGVDYGVFLAESHDSAGTRGATLLSIAIACASSLLAFGLLGLSSNPALRAVGVTTAIGLIASLLLAPAALLLLRQKEPS